MLSFDLLLHFLDAFEVVYSLDAQFGCSVVIGYNKSPRVELDGGNSPEMVDTLLDAFAESESFAAASDEDDCGQPG
jgi:hypothetical protein